MGFAVLGSLKGVVRKGRMTLQRAFPTLTLRVQRRLPGQFQPYNHTLPDRYPWLFRFVSSHLSRRKDLRILSFGCSRGDEVFTLRKYFPTAAVKGIDVNPDNIAHCLERARTERAQGMTFATAATTAGEPATSYDAIFCLSTLCLGDLGTLRMQRCDPFLRFADFESVVADFARCLKPGGLLLLLGANFRFCDTAVANNFDVALEAQPAQLAPDPTFDRDDRLMTGERYCAVAFRKRGAAESETQ